MEIVVFTNGCFDIVHAGHVDLLARAKALGTRLIVGINSDSSARAIKGEDRPFMNETERATVLENLKSVDEVIVFDERTPENLIRKIKPDVLVKGGDWSVAEIVGADFVLANGGRVLSLPLVGDFSSSAIVSRIRGEKANENVVVDKFAADETAIIENSLKNHIEVFQTILKNHIKEIYECAELIIERLAAGNKILLCGNGGSAADAQHIAAEFVGRYETERRALPAIALTTDTSALTALANDYSFEKVFARQVEALAASGDVLIALSTSGNSPNVVAAVMTARRIGCKTIGLTGAGGKKLASLCDRCFLVPARKTARIQEAHIAIAHVLCELVDRKITDKS